MSGELRIRFADWLGEREMRMATAMILAFATAVSEDAARRTLTVEPNRGEREMLKDYLAVWEKDRALSWSDAD